MSTPAASSDRLTLRSFWLDLPREGRYLLSTIIVDFIGTGLVMPFNVVYLHEVRGFELARVGVLLALPALVGLLVVGPIGTLIDRIGPRVVVIGSLVVQIVAQITLASATTELRAAIGCVLLGFSGGVIWPAIQTLIGTIIPSHLRQRYFGVNFTLLNLGIGIGGILGGLFVDVTRPETFVAIYLIDAATFLAPLAIFLGPLRHVHRPPAPSADEEGRRRRRRPDRLPRGTARPFAAALPVAHERGDEDDEEDQLQRAVAKQRAVARAAWGTVLVPVLRGRLGRAGDVPQRAEEDRQRREERGRVDEVDGDERLRPGDVDEEAAEDAADPDAEVEQREVDAEVALPQVARDDRADQGLDGWPDDAAREPEQDAADGRPRAPWSPRPA